MNSKTIILRGGPFHGRIYQPKKLHEVITIPAVSVQHVLTGGRTTPSLVPKGTVYHSYARIDEFEDGRKVYGHRGEVGKI